MATASFPLRRIQFAMESTAGEDITFELGMHNAQSVFRRLEERLRQLSIASNE